MVVSPGSIPATSKFPYLPPSLPPSRPPSRPSSRPPCPPVPIVPYACMCVIIQDSSTSSTLKICFNCSSARYASTIPAQDMLHLNASKKPPINKGHL
ncbi:hypothetical protein GHT06_009424 [Daphnia sinensis]|uniref:Uncharacterized protein n=1 Tax=Daphnia sinensis TaxID=1820382 RepID=A0AAD5L414_9CRUS|nr:hypothetical protein GHT06_009424 [Daphnia sinensis]